MKKVEDMKEINFMVERLTEDAGQAFSPARYNLKSRNKSSQNINQSRSSRSG